MISKQKAIPKFSILCRNRQPPQIMSETEPKYYTKSELNHMLEVVELFSEYEQMQQEIDDLKMENENLKERNKMLRGILVDALRGY